MKSAVLVGRPARLRILSGRLVLRLCLPRLPPAFRAFALLLRGNHASQRRIPRLSRDEPPKRVGARFAGSRRPGSFPSVAGQSESDGHGDKDLQLIAWFLSVRIIAPPRLG